MTGEGIYLIQEDGGLLELSEQPYESEELLQQLLERYPSLLAGRQMSPAKPRRWVLVTREAGMPSRLGGSAQWSADHVFLDQDAVPTIVEVKRSSDTRILCEVVGQMLPDRPHTAQTHPEPPTPRLGPSASREDALDDVRSDLLAALTATSGYPPIERASYTSVADRPVWAFVERRAGSIVVKFRVAPPYRVADTVAAHLADGGVAAQVRDVRSRSGSTRLWIYLEGPADLACLRPELQQLWRDYLRLK
jgi:hypothetical protein